MIKSRTTRSTHQREVILNKLRMVKNHPSAEELYKAVKKSLPTISLATVYRNLDWLSENGFIRKIEVGGRQKRFDAITETHYHIRCLNCDRIEDVMNSGFCNICCPEELNGFAITGHNIEFFGWCPSCLQKKSKGD